MKDSPGKNKPTLASLLGNNQIITGKDLISRRKKDQAEAAKQKAILQEAMEFEERNRRTRKPQ